MLSNKKWFNYYIALRTTVILTIIILFLFKISLYFSLAYESTWTLLVAMFLPLLGTILLFDYWQKPSFLELSKEKKRLVLKMYQPDTRYFFFLKENAIKQLSISDGDKLTYQFHKNVFSALNQLVFLIQKKDDQIIKTNKINIGWMNQYQLKQLNQMVNEQNKHFD